MDSKATNQEQPSFENVLEALGVPGTYQVTQTALVLCCKTVVTLSIMSFVFLGYEPPHVCNGVEEGKILEDHGMSNDSQAWIHYGPCHVNIYTNRSGQAVEMGKLACPNGRNFSGGKHSSYLSEWDLVCESRGRAEFVETLFVIGNMVSGLISTTIADKYGRKHFIFICTLLTSVFETAIAFAPSIYVVMALRFFSGVFVQSVVCTYFVFGIELVVPRHRQTQGVLVYCNAWVVHILVLAGIAYGWRHGSWQHLQLTIAASGLLCLLLPRFLKESPRWLAINNQRERTLDVLKDASRQNGTDFEKVKAKLDSFWKYIGQYENVIESDDDLTKTPSRVKVRKQGNGVNILTLLRNRRLLRITILTWFIWTTHIMTYFGLFLTSTNLTGDRFLNFTLMTLVEVPSNLIVLMAMNRMNRKPVLMIFLGLTAASLMASTLLLTFGDNSPEWSILSTALIITGKLFIGASFNVIYVMTPELYPTNLRSVGNGINTSSALGGMLAPYMRPLFVIAKWAPGFIFTVMCFISVVMVTALPETKDVDLPNYVDDLEEKGRKTNCVALAAGVDGTQLCQKSLTDDSLF